ncbi:hypothetical protein NBRC116587_22460 [Pseudoteredinibacter isoporae]
MLQQALLESPELGEAAMIPDKPLIASEFWLFEALSQAYFRSFLPIFSLRFIRPILRQQA